MKFYVCKHCGNIITFEENKGVPVVCCGEKMSELVPGSVDAAAEKHVPVISVEATRSPLPLAKWLTQCSKSISSNGLFWKPHRAASAKS